MSERTPFTPIHAGAGPWEIDEIRQMPLFGFQKNIGIVFSEITPNRVCGSLNVCNHHINSVGKVHGGVLISLADSMGAAGALQNIASYQKTATLESKTNFIATPKGESLYAVCQPIHIGRRTSVWTTVITDQCNKVIATTTQTQLHFDANGT